MGCFSFTCQLCNYGIRSGKKRHLEWMNECVAIPRDAHLENYPKVIKGAYDDYGRISSPNGRFVDVTGVFDLDVSWYHYDCWKALGKPTSYVGASKCDPLQGWGDTEEDNDMYLQTLGYVPCQSCDNPIEEDHDFCPSCGVEIER